ncbi:MAG: type I secretion system permease/ATPase [Cognatishimia sp.]|uniref:type I secretion system permease/ATPase n=1 Tax=Cognatishimia sp. TaxID=2211648 RepID=UPI003B8ACA09
MSKMKLQITPGRDELRAVRRESRMLYWSVALFSAFANLLMLTGPMYMLQVYDRVLSSRSIETLVALTALVAFLYCIMGVLDFTRGRILARIGARFQTRLERRVFDAVLTNSSRAQTEGAQTGLSDLAVLQRFISSPAPTVVFDIPWTPVFLVGLSIFHPWLGYLAMAGGGVLIVIALLNQTLMSGPLQRSNINAHGAALFAEQLRVESELVQSLGLQTNAFKRWRTKSKLSLREQLVTTDISGFFTTSTKTVRLFLQSAMLGLGAVLVLRGELSAGAMIAGSILMGRALAPIELAIGQWPTFQRARKSWDTLATLLSKTPYLTPQTQLPSPRAKLKAQSLTIVPPGRTKASLRMINFVLEPGQAMGVIGPSGAGKSTLAKAITGTWPAAGGNVRLDQATIDQYRPERLGEYIGYLPQRVQLFDGTIAENIARLSPDPDDAQITAAAQQADAHDMILKLPEGYDTPVSATGGRLSGGQIQRIGLARALYSDPVVLVLDEPNSNLDNQGADALNTAIRRVKAQGKSVVIMAHRPAAIHECDLLLVLKNGTVEAFGPRDTILHKSVQNHESIISACAAGGIQ